MDFENLLKRKESNKILLRSDNSLFHLITVAKFNGNDCTGNFMRPPDSPAAAAAAPTSWQLPSAGSICCRGRAGEPEQHQETAH